MRRSSKHGFTLVELLVVIGIIALLISILLPSLNKARQAGQRIACSAQLRQFGIAFTMYLNDNRSTYPAAFESRNLALDWFDPAQLNTPWTGALKSYLGDKSDPTKSSNLNIFTCPNDGGLDRVTWLQGGKLSYTMPTSMAYFETTYYSNAGLSGPGNHRIGVGQLFVKSANAADAGMRIRANMVKPVTKVILVTELARDIATQNSSYPSTYILDYAFVPSANLRLHEGKFNYLFCDGHVETLFPKETVKNPLQVIPSNYITSGSMWTIRPDKY